MEILDKKYEDVLSQLRLANERNMQQSQKLNELESALFAKSYISAKQVDD